jgi:WD40 repeat protein/serine/threonine protein kinase/tetratricopeptide (TPR) repeat protein
MNEHELFAAALEIDGPDERSAYLDRSCGGDDALRARVEALLRAHERAGSFLQAVPVAGAATLDAPKPLEGPGTVIGPYKLLQPIGEGGMGTVYMAEQTAPVRRLVALKVIKAGMDTRQVLARFGAERQALALMDHPNIAKVFDAGTTDTGRPYFVMELVKGIPITRYCDDRRLTLRERLELFIPVCQSLQHAHQKGVIHRDLKPSNILVAQYDGRPVPKVIDFGVAKATGPRLTDQTLYTEFGSVVGTLEYMSPEQAELNQLDIDTRSDVYSLGAVLYELLTGSTPLGRDRLKSGAFLEMLRIIREEDSPRPSVRLSTTEELPSIAACRQVEPRKLSSLLRGELDWIVMKALEKDRNRRYETANGLAADLRRYLDDEPVQACPPSAWYRLRKFARRNRAALATAAVVAASLVAVAVLSVLYADRQRRFAIDKAEAARNITALAGDLETSLAGSNRLLAMRNFDRGQAAFEKDQIGQGLLWMIESWRAAIDAGDPAWQHAARANLAAWQPHHPRLKAVLSHPSPVAAAVFSPDGKMIVTGSDDRTAQLWDAATARPAGPPLRHEGEVISVAFSPDGQAILTGSHDRTARLWDVATGRQIGSPLQHPNGLTSVAFSPDGKTVVTGCSDGTTRLWDPATGRSIGTPVQHPDVVVSATFSPDGKTLLIASIAGGAHLCDAATGRTIRSIVVQGRAWSAAFSPDGNTFLTGSDGAVQQWNAATGTLLGERARHRLKIRSVAMSPDGRTVVTGSEDKSARLWDAVTNQPLGLPVVHQGPVAAVAFSPDGKTFLTASSDNTVALWDADPGQPFGLILCREAVGQTLAFSPDGESIYSADWGGAVKRWDTSTGLIIGPTMSHQGPVGAVAVSPDGTRLLTGSYDKTARLWDTAKGKPVGPALEHEGAVSVVAFCSDGQIMMTGGEDQTIRLWDVATGTPLGRPIPQAGSVDGGAFSPDGRSFVAGHASGSAQVWDVATRTPLGPPIPHPGGISAAAFSPDGKALLTGCEDGAARLWDMETRSPRIPPLVHQAWIWSVAFSPDGKIVLTGSRDRTARLWDAASGMPLGPAIPHPAQVWTVVFSPDGKSILTGCTDDGARLFRRVPELPDDLSRIAIWVEVLTGLTLDAGKGSIRVLDNAAWRERRRELEHLGGPPETEGGPRRDPILLGLDPLARGRVLMQREQWDEAEVALDEVVRARPYNASSWIGVSGLHAARGQLERAAADIATAIQSQPENLQLRHFQVLLLLNQGDRAGLRQACTELLARYGSVTNLSTANMVAWSCALGPEAVADREAPIGLAELAVNRAQAASRPAFLNTLGAALYRAGRFQEAINRLEEGIRKRGGESLPEDWSFLALAHHGLGHHTEARAWLDRLRTHRPNVSDGAFWNELEIRLLRREAEAVILYDPMFPTDPFAH